MNRRTLLGVVGLALMMSCSQPKPATIEAEPPAPESADTLYLTPVEHLIRASVDIRGIRPSVTEMRAIEKNPDKLRDTVYAYMEDPRFYDRVMDIWNQAFLVNRDMPFFPGPPTLQGIATQDDFARAANKETLHLVAHVVTQDRPFTEVVTADYTMANGVLAEYYDIKRGGWPADLWVESKYEDGRSHAGVLSTNSMHTRWTTTNANKNRARANAWTRSILCYDFLKRDVDLDTAAIDFSQPGALENAIATLDACKSCHQALDPLGSYFFGYFIPEEPDNGEAERSYPVKTYSQNQEPRWQQETGRDPGYFGHEAGSRFADLGSRIAEDPRFSMCAVNRFSAALTGLYLKDLDFIEQDRLHDHFVATEYNAKELVAEIVMSTHYRVKGPKEATASDVVGLKLLHPEVLNRTLQDIAGMDWELAAPLGYKLLENDIYGFRMMSGGFDSDFVTAPANTVNATHILTLRMAAADAAGLVVDRELQMSPRDRRLLTQIAGDEADHEIIREQGADLFLKIFGESHDPHSPPIDDMTILWQSAYDRSGDAQYAWKVTLTALFSDVRIVFY